MRTATGNALKDRLRDDRDAVPEIALSGKQNCEAVARSEGRRLIEERKLAVVRS